MNDFVLKGFCKRCSKDYTFDDIQNDWSVCVAHKPKIEWFLSGKQMKIITRFANKMSYETEEVRRPWEELEKYFYEEDFYLWKLLEKNPFLVAKILKELRGVLGKKDCLVNSEY